MWVKKQQSEPSMEQVTGSGLRKDYDEAFYCHPVSLVHTLKQVDFEQGHKVWTFQSGRPRV